MPQVEAGHGVQTHVLVSAAGTLHTAVDGLAPLAAQAAERARPFGDVVFEQVDPGVALLPQVGRGHVGHAGCLLVVVGHRVVHVGVGVCELLKRLAPCRKTPSIRGGRAPEQSRTGVAPPLKGFP